MPPQRASPEKKHLLRSKCQGTHESCEWPLNKMKFWRAWTALRWRISPTIYQKLLYCFLTIFHKTIFPHLDIRAADVSPCRLVWMEFNFQRLHLTQSSWQGEKLWSRPIRCDYDTATRIVHRHIPLGNVLSHYLQVFGRNSTPFFLSQAIITN